MGGRIEGSFPCEIDDRNDRDGRLARRRQTRLSREAPDGYTIALAGDAPISVNVHLQKGIGYDPIKDLRPIFRIGKAPNLLVVHPEKGPKTLVELIATARENPGALSFRSTGTGTSQHIALELLKSRAKIDILHVPGGGPAAPDIMGGHVTGSFMNFPAALPQIKAGTLRALTQTGLTRASSAPDIPTLVELGFPGFEAAPWFGLFAPKGTPDSVIAAIVQAMTNAMAEPEFRDKLVAIGLELDTPGTSGQFADFIAAELRAWRTSCGQRECRSHPELVRKVRISSSLPSGVDRRASQADKRRVFAIRPWTSCRQGAPASDAPVSGRNTSEADIRGMPLPRAGNSGASAQRGESCR